MNPPVDKQEESPAPQRGRAAWTRRLLRLGIIAGVLVVVATMVVVGAEYYTSQPTFCGSCHIMDPYYESWHNDVHSSTDQGQAYCVDCHYAPGQQHTFEAKFRGLSQAASYFSGRSGAGRPKAHVRDNSCLRSGCHGDLAYMGKDYPLGTVEFSHAKHLDTNGENLRGKQTQLAELRAKLLETLGAARLDAIDAIAKTVMHADQRRRRLTTWLGDEVLSAWQDDVLEYAELIHMEVRVDQLSGLKCASCHQFDASLEHHFTAAKTVCYTCHFINQPFNRNTATCLNCHEPPAGPVPVHYGQHAGGGSGQVAEDVTMDHAMIIAHNVTCSSCHTDLIHGVGQVTRRDCENCHDQQRYLADFDELNTDIVREYHRVHAAAQFARCSDCHELIDHKLTPLADPQSAVALLAPVRQDCDHCHSEHHREVVDLLLGQGGFVEGAQGVANPMTGSRANCRACHTQAGADPKGEMVLTSTREACQGCHGEDYEELFARWQHAVQARLEEARGLLTSVETRLSAAASQPQQRDLDEARRLLNRARRNVQLVATANGLHNKNYALMLLDQAVMDLERIAEELTQ